LNFDSVPFIVGQLDDLANLQQVVIVIGWPDVDEVMAMIGDIVKGKSMINLAKLVRKNLCSLDGTAVTRTEPRHGF